MKRIFLYFSVYVYKSVLTHCGSTVFNDKTLINDPDNVIVITIRL